MEKYKLIHAFIKRMAVAMEKKNSWSRVMLLALMNEVYIEMLLDSGDENKQ
jgi:hypothetical protein